jgi:DNA-binding Lrp family transcriptional regulator
MRLDEIDIKIINMLKENARISISELSKALKLSRQTVKSRIERLERDGVIERYTIKLACRFENSGSSFLLLANVSDEGKLMEIDEIVEINRITSRKFLLRVNVADVNELSRVIDEAELDALEILPVIERKVKDVPFKAKVNYRCDYCGKEMFDEPIIYRYRNRVYVLCCKTCLREFKDVQEVKG